MPLIGSPSYTKFVLSFLYLIALCGCTSNVTLHQAISEDHIKDPSKGLLIARFVNATGYPAPLNYMTVTVENVNESDEVKHDRLVTPDARSLDATSVFASELAPGNYTLSSFSAYHTSDSIYYSYWVPGTTELGTFTVKAGEVTDLGSIAYYRQNEKDTYRRTAIRIPNTATGEVLTNHFKFYESTPADINTWNEDGLSTERYETYLSALQNPTAFSKRHLAEDGTLYIAAPLGAVVTRSADGVWGMEAIDTNLRVLQIVENQIGDIVFAGADGSVHIRSADGSWSDISLSSPLLVHEVFFTAENTLDILGSYGHELKVLRKNLTITESKWELIDKYDTVSSWQSLPKVVEDKKLKAKPPKYIGEANYQRKAGESGILTIRGFSKTYEPLLDLGIPKKFKVTPGQWKFTPHDTRLDEQPERILSAGAVKLKAQSPSFWSWSGKSSLLRLDVDTDQWVPLSKWLYRCNKEYTTSPVCVDERGTKTPSKKRIFSFTGVPWFKNEKEAVALVTFSNLNFWTGNTKYETHVLHSSDGGSSWQVTDLELPDKYCKDIVGEISDTLLLSCNGISGDFYESKDLGQTWDHVREHESF